MKIPRREFITLLGGTASERLESNCKPAMLKQFVSPDVFGDLDSRRMWTDGNQGAALMELLPFVGVIR
jgi:hypothetical protein